MTVTDARQRRLRERISRLVGSGEVPDLDRPVDVVVSHVEVCEAHGTGLLTKLIFGGSPGLVSVRSHDQYGGTQDFGDPALRLPSRDSTPNGDLGDVLAAFLDLDVQRIVCIPYFSQDVSTTLALQGLFDAPLCTFVMDDNNIEGDGIRDEDMRELLARSALRLAISPELRDAYERKFGLRFWLVPPLVAPRLILREPLVPSDGLTARRGAIVGNIWGSDWLEALRATVRASGVELDWYCNSGTRWLTVTRAALAADGIHVKGSVPERELLDRLRRVPFVVVPSGTLDGRDTRRAIARFSLPSRIPFVVATAHAPLVVLGHPDTAAARFVTGASLGEVAPYDRGRFVAAVEAILSPSRQAAIRGRAAELAPIFSAEGARDWIWRSLALGRAVDERWERLLVGSERKPGC